MANSHEYEMALEQFRRCSAAFRAITAAYRARTIGDDEYLAARKDFGTATRLMDEAHDKEAWRQRGLPPGYQSNGDGTFSMDW